MTTYEAKSEVTGAVWKITTAVGDRIEVTRSDRSVVTFKVDTVEYFDKANLPADRVYGESGPAELRLITCGGEWVGGHTGYEDNVIAFASLLDTRNP